MDYRQVAELREAGRLAREAKAQAEALSAKLREMEERIAELESRPRGPGRPRKSP